MAAAAVLALLLASALAGAAAGGDIVHHDDEAPKIPGCSNDFVLVRWLSCMLSPPHPQASLQRSAYFLLDGMFVFVCYLGNSSCEFTFPFRSRIESLKWIDPF
jgi:hypothetical protein